MMRRLLQRFWRDRRGVSALEFALIAPAMIAFYLGVAETTQAIMADRRNSHVASTIGDLASQSSQLTDDAVSDIFGIGETIMKPFPTDTLKNRLTSVTVNSSGVAKVDWCEVMGGFADTADGSTYSLPSDLTVKGESVIVAESTYTYTTPIKGATFTMVEKRYFKPRRSAKVLRGV